MSMSIQDITRLFEIKDSPTDKDHICRKQGFLYPNVQSRVHSYGEAALEVDFFVLFRNQEYQFFGTIRSLDDSGISFFGPGETQEKAYKRFLAFEEFLNQWQHKCPDEEVIKEFCLNAGIYPDWW